MNSPQGGILKPVENDNVLSEALATLFKDSSQKLPPAECNISARLINKSLHYRPEKVTTTMRYLLLILITITVPISTVRSQHQPPEPKKILGIINEDSSWSPDGKSIAFDSSRPGKTSIFTWVLETRELKRLTSGEANDVAPDWSPDSKQIAFVSDRTGHNEIYVIDASGGEPRQITTDKSDNLHPLWSPDGRRIIYCSARDNPDQALEPKLEIYEIYTITPNGTDPKRITNDNGINTYASYSRDGKRIVFRKIIAKNNSEVFVMNADGSSLRNLTNNPGFDGWPGWSPDDSKIVFGSNRGGKDYQIYVMNADGTDVQQLTHFHGRNTSPKWSPDGKNIAFDHAAQGECDIYLVNVPSK